MNTLVIYCHPSKKSFTYQVFKRLLNGLTDAGHQVVISDLYAMNFQSDMSEKEYEREQSALYTKPLPNDVLLEQHKIQHSDCIIFVYPVWWSDCPAKLKGWFDRVYSVGFAYGYNTYGEGIIKMKKQQLGLVLCTAGHPYDFLMETGIAESMRKVMMDDRLGLRFEKKVMKILGGTLNIDQVRDKHLATAYDVGKNISGYCS